MPDSDSNDPPMLDYARPTTDPPWPRWVAFVLVAMLIIIIVALLNIRATHIVSRPTNNRVKSASNLRQIGLAIAQYTKDYGGMLPDSFQTLLVGENISSEFFVSSAKLDTPATGPTTRDIADQLTAGGHLSYVYLGDGLTTKTVRPDTIIAYETLDQPSDGTNVLFGDGIVEWFEPAVAAGIVARAASGQVPVTMPSRK